MSYSLHLTWLAAICLAFTTGCNVESTDQPMVETQRPIIDDDDDDVDTTTVVPAAEDDVDVNETTINETDVTPVTPVDQPDTNNNIDLNIDDSAEPAPLNPAQTDTSDASPEGNDAEADNAETDAAPE